MKIDEQAFYEAVYAPCGRCDGSGVEPSDADAALCSDCGGFGEVELER